ncbi:unnamed protein product, partial [Rotaria sp. Silwood2]
MMNDVVSISVTSQHTAESAFVIDDPRETMNRILTEVNLSSVRSQTTKSIKNQSKSGLHRLVSKFKRELSALQEKLAETLMPGQGQELIQIAQLQSQAREEQQFQLSISNEMVQSHRSWKYEKVMSTFGCTRHAITAAHQMYDDEEYLLNKDQEPVIRQRADPGK